MASSMSNRELVGGSDFYKEGEHHCKPCSVVGKIVTASLFCVDCAEYLCQMCSTYHKALTATSNHLQVNADEAKRAPSVIPRDKCDKKCSVHKGKTIKYFCVSHAHLGCSVCFYTDHKLCYNVEHIQTEAADIKEHTGFKQFDEGLRTLNTAYEGGVTDFRNKLKLVKADERQLKGAFDDFRSDLDAALNTLENDLLTEAKTVKDEELTKLECLSKKLETSKAAVEALIHNVDILVTSGKHCDAYVLAKTDAERLEYLQDELVKTTRDQEFRRYEFKPNMDALKVGALGMLTTRVENIACNIPTTNTTPTSNSPPIIRRSHVSSSHRVSGSDQVVGRGHVTGTAKSKSIVKKIDWRAMAERIQNGDRVRRGKDWNPGYCNQDGGPGALGTVLGSTPGYDGWYTVRWYNGVTGHYRMGWRDTYDLELV